MTELKDVKVIFSCLAGSHMYGTNIPESDEDIRGVFIAPKKYYTGFLYNIEQIENEKKDITYFDLRKFMLLASQCNPNIVELLFVPFEKAKDWSPIWEEVLDNRSLFISSKARWTFSGYAYAQLHRIQQHRKWLLHPQKNKPERKDYGLPEEKSLLSKDQIGAFNTILATYLNEIALVHPLKQQIDEMLETKDFKNIIDGIRNIPKEAYQAIVPTDDNFIEALRRENSYLQVKSDWDKYQNWKANRNPKRAILEEKYGFDVKHGAHLVRLISEGEELLTTGKITLPRPDTEYLKEIRSGKYSYDELMSVIGNLDEKFDKLYNTTKLPKKPDIVKIEELCEKLVWSELNSGEQITLS